MRKAFTLIELLVVIGIIVILLGIAVPAIKMLTKGNNQKQTVNLLTSLIANARSQAIQSHSWSGLVVYEDPNAKNQTAAQLIQSLPSNPAQPSIVSFVRSPHTAPQILPAGIKIAALDSQDAAGGQTGGFKTESDTANTNCRCILFDENGQMILRNGLAADASLITDASAQAWNLRATVGNEPRGTSKPGFVVYDAQAYNDASMPTATVTVREAWLINHSDVVIVNAYTGNVIR